MVSRESEPVKCARRCRREIDAEFTYELDLAELAAGLGILVRQAPISGFLGAALIENGQEAVCLAEGQYPPRKRFTLAHEIGHLQIPDHREVLKDRPLVDHQISLAQPGGKREAEANEFAAELLAPCHLAKPMVEGKEIDVRRAIEIAETFGVSVSSACLRVADLSGEACAVIQMESGSVKWFVRKSGFPYGVPGPGEDPPERTVTAHVANTGAAFKEAIEVKSEDWLSRRAGNDSVSMYESSMRLGKTGLQITVLWIPSAG